jgi:hypothetical protein
MLLQQDVEAVGLLCGGINGLKRLAQFGVLAAKENSLRNISRALVLAWTVEGCARGCAVPGPERSCP